jgi:hypothetical protein
LDGVFARFRFLAKAIGDAQVERAKSRVTSAAAIL